MGNCSGSGRGGGSGGTSKSADEIVSGWNLTKLTEMGANRWQKNDKDRLYLSKLGPEIMGLERSYYKSGNVSAAWKDGEKISNSESFRVVEAYRDAYINLSTGEIKGVKGRYADEFVEKLQKFKK